MMRKKYSAEKNPLGASGENMNVLSFIFISKHRFTPAGCFASLAPPRSARFTSLGPGPGPSASASTCFLSIPRKFPRENCFVLRVPV